MAPLAPYVPDQFEMARRALVASATPDGSVNVATDPSVGSSPFLYGRAKPKTPLEQQMEREQRRQLQEQQRYDQLQNELTFVPQWAADRMGPGATMEARRRGAETLRSLPQPAGTPMTDAYARSEQDIANIPRAGRIARAEGDLDAEAAAMRFFSPNQVIMRARQQQEAANAPARQEDQRFGLVRTLLQGAFSNPNFPPNWQQVNTILEMAGMAMPAGGGAGGGDNVVTRAEIAQEAAATGVSAEDLEAGYLEQGLQVVDDDGAGMAAPAAAAPTTQAAPATPAADPYAELEAMVLGNSRLPALPAFGTAPIPRDPYGPRMSWRRGVANMQPPSGAAAARVPSRFGEDF